MGHPAKKLINTVLQYRTLIFYFTGSGLQRALDCSICFHFFLWKPICIVPYSLCNYVMPHSMLPKGLISLPLYSNLLRMTTRMNLMERRPAELSLSLSTSSHLWLLTLRQMPFGVAKALVITSQCGKNSRVPYDLQLTKEKAPPLLKLIFAYIHHKLKQTTQKAIYEE